MVPNQILKKMAAGEKALGLSFKEASGELVDLAGRAGLDFVVFDAQHTPVTPSEIAEMCWIADSHGMTVSVRIPDKSESTILSYLDRGVKSITIPNLLTKAEAEDIVKYSFFAPLGLRSATSVAIMNDQADGDHVKLFQEVNDNTFICPQLESTVSLQNLDEILAVEGINFFSGGAEDMAQSLGFPGQPGHPKVKETYKLIEDKIRAAGKYMMGDFMESIAVFDLTKNAIQDLLERNGREFKVGW